MRLRDLIIGTLLCAICFSCGLVVGRVTKQVKEEITIAAQSTSIDNTPKPIVPTPTPTPTITKKNEKEQFMLSLSDQSIHVYKLLPSGQAELIYKTSIEDGQLREEDYASLCRGIIVDSEEKARELAEDFGN